jgi:hypothetical protein
MIRIVDAMSHVCVVVRAAHAFGTPAMREYGTPTSFCTERLGHIRLAKTGRGRSWTGGAALGDNAHDTDDSQTRRTRVTWSPGRTRTREPLLA